MEKKSSVKVGGIVSYVAIVFEIVAGFFYVPWMIKQLGQSNYGIFSLAASIATLLSVDLGLSAAASKFVAKYRAEKNEQMANNVASLITKIFLIFDIFILVVMVVAFFLLDVSFSKNFTIEELSSLKVVYVIIGLYSILIFPTSPIAGYLNGNDKFTIVRVINLLTKVLSVCSIILCLSLGFGLYGFVICNCAATILSRIVFSLLFYCTNNFGNRLKFKYWDKEIFKDVFKYIIWSGIIVLAEKIIVYSVPYILGIFCGTSSISVYQVGFTIDNYYLVVTTAVDGFFIARLSEMYQQKFTPEDFTNYWIKAARMQLLISALFFVGYLCVGNEFMTLWLRNNNEANPHLSYIVAILMMFPVLLSSTQQIGNTLLIVQDKIRFRAIGYIISSGLCVGLIFILSALNAKEAILMASISVLVGRTFLSVYSLYVFKHKLGLGIFKFLRKTYLSLCPIAVGIVVAMLFVNRFIVANNWLILGAKIAGIVIVYCLFVWFLWLKKEERQFLMPKFLTRKRVC